MLSLLIFLGRLSLNLESLDRIYFKQQFEKQVILNDCCSGKIF